MKSTPAIILISTLFITFSSCDKDTEVLKETELSDCPANTTCSYTYNDNLKIEDHKLTIGTSRVFQAKFKKNYMTSGISFSTQGNKEFYISDSDIKSGAVQYFFICPTCNYFEVKPIGGYIKGSKAGSNEWLIDAEIILGGSHVPSYRDTIRIKQHFSPGLKPGPFYQ